MRLTLLVCCVVVSSSALAADSLGVAQAHFKEAEAALKVASEASRQANVALRSCTRGALQLQFGPSVDRLEKVRKSLEQARRDAQSYRSGLESLRRQIESSKGSTYGDRLLTEYATPLDERLVPVLKGYATGINQWSAVFVKYGAFCAAPEYTTSKGAGFVATANADIDALSTTATDLVASGAAAKSTLPVAVAGAKR